MRKANRIVVIANRLPVRRATGGRELKWESSTGGLVTALKSVLQNTKGIWIGSTGTAGVTPRPFIHDRVRIQSVPVKKKEVEFYYNGLSNKTLWPLYHDAICTPQFNRRWWKPYCTVNQRFAEYASRVVRKGDTVWIHDYHLQLVPQMLRTLRPDLRIGYFLHIPFPPDELFEWLPWRTDILNGMLGADLVGFQTLSGAQNFSRAARKYTVAKGAGRNLRLLTRSVRVDSFPVSIDAAWWSQRSDRPETRRRALEIKERVGGNRKILLAVDRLDYTKGIVERLHAFEELLGSGKATVHDCVLIQLAVPTRETVGDYAQLRSTVEQMVGRINGQFSVPGMVAVHYFRRNHTREELAAFYRAADVMLVTPLRDGMNLVAKEYVACRTEDRGVLVLSQFAGAAKELTEAILVNPRDTDQMVATFRKALTMNETEVLGRMRVLRRQVNRHDVYAWADRFLEVLRG